MRAAAIIVMGVSGSGKSTIGALLAERLGWPFADADGFHPPENVAKMAAGTPLTDADRWPWLDAIAAHIDAARKAGQPVVVACSALRRAYRDRIRAGAGGPVQFVHLTGSRAVIAALPNEPLVVDKLFDEIVPKYADRTSGYCRITKIGIRQGDSSPLVQIELV